jgi:hypothetical protein
VALAVNASSQQTFIEIALSKEEPEMFAKGNLTYSAVQLPDRVEMNANDGAVRQTSPSIRIHSTPISMRSLKNATR